MGKYDKLFPTWTKEELDKHQYEIRLLYQQALADKLEGQNDIGGLRQADKDYLKETRIRRSLNVFETAMVGPFTLEDILPHLKMDFSPYRDHPELLANAIVEHLGGAKFNFVEDKSGHYTAELSQKMLDDIQAFENNDEKYMLTRWDKFWGLFGYKTDHARKVEFSRAAVQAYKERQHAINKVVVPRQLADKRDSALKLGKSSYENLKGAADSARGCKAGWNRIFFGKDIPNSYTTAAGKKISPLSLCLAMLHQNTEYDLSLMKPTEFAELVNNNQELRDKVREISDKVTAIIKDKETAIDLSNKLKYSTQQFDLKDASKALDETVKALLKPEKARKMVITKGWDYYTMGKDKKEEKEKVFGCGSIILTVLADMAKLFGKNDSVYAKTGFTKNLEKDIKNTLGAVNVYEAVQKEEYDKVLEIAPDGKGDYHNLYTVLNRCNRNLKTAERNFNTEIKTFGMANPNPVAETKPKVEENQIDEPEMTNEM